MQRYTWSQLLRNSLDLVGGNKITRLCRKFTGIAYFMKLFKSDSMLIIGTHHEQFVLNYPMTCCHTLSVRPSVGDTVYCIGNG